MTMSLKPGDILFDHRQHGASRAAIALFSRATEDPNPIHVDEAFAKECGFPQVLQQGPMTTAHFARLLGAAVGAARLKVLDVTFTAPVFPEEVLLLRASVEKVEGGDIHLALRAQKEDGTLTATGSAVVAGEA